MACKYLENFDGNILILCGDTPLITEETLKKFIEYHNSSNSDLTVMSAIFDNPTNYGRIIQRK
jgi:bifunctional UDP-N-acetylglucosamine pyrophosphorylase/glucosamine-1-phosphate N-acetyltransferase